MTLIVHKENAQSVDCIGDNPSLASVKRDCSVIYRSFPSLLHQMIIMSERERGERRGERGGGEDRETRDKKMRGQLYKTGTYCSEVEISSKREQIILHILFNHSLSLRTRN